MAAQQGVRGEASANGDSTEDSTAVAQLGTDDDPGTTFAKLFKQVGRTYGICMIVRFEMQEFDVRLLLSCEFTLSSDSDLMNGRECAQYYPQGCTAGHCSRAQGCWDVPERTLLCPGESGGLFELHRQAVHSTRTGTIIFSLRIPLGVRWNTQYPWAPGQF